MRLTLHELHELATDALIRSSTSPENARTVAEALVAADRDGIASHGVSRIPFYADQAASGKVDGFARPEISSSANAAVCVDARDGFAYPAIRLGLARGLECVSEHAVVGVTISNSHHSGAGGYHVEPPAERGLVALGFTNTPSAIAPWGGIRSSFGTNPIAFACPRSGATPLVVDLSLSRAARGKIVLAAEREEPIPADWAVDADGLATTDAQAALAGSMLPIGEAKGAALALVVEILAAGLSGSNFAFEASSFFTPRGPAPRIGQCFILIDPTRFAGEAFTDRVEVLLRHVLEQDGARLPGARRLAHRRAAERDGVVIPEALYEDLRRRGARA